MRLSIFNSKKSVSPIKVFLYTTIISAFAYIFIIEAIKPNITEGLSQRQDNMIKIESFLFDQKKMKGIILGTSLSARIELPGFTNLALAGESLRTAVEILSRHPIDSETIVLIETNFLSESLNRSLLKDVFSFPQYQLKTLSLAFQERGQPASLAKALLKKLMKRPKPQDIFVTQIFEMMLPNILKNFENLPSTNLDSQYPLYFESLLKLSRNNQLISFQLPMDPSIMNVEGSLKHYEAVSKKLKELKIPQILPPKEIEFQTTDGIHLTTKSRRKYEKWLIKKI